MKKNARNRELSCLDRSALKPLNAKAVTQTAADDNKECGSRESPGKQLASPVDLKSSELVKAVVSKQSSKLVSNPTVEPFDTQEYQKFISEILSNRNKSQRFQQLKRFYDHLGRIAALEKTSSSLDCIPIPKRQIIDYDLWQVSRFKAKTQKELQKLYDELDFAQRNREFLYKAGDDSHWKRDRLPLRNLGTVENIKKKLIESMAKCRSSSSNDVYKSMWRSQSVADLTEKFDLSYIPKSPVVPTLSREKLETLKNTLNQLYSPRADKQKDRSLNVAISDNSEERKFRDVTRPVTLSQEILSHVTEHYPLSNFDNPYSDCAELDYPKSSSPSLSQTSPRTCYSAIASEMGSERSSSPERFAKNNNFLLVLAPDHSKSLPEPGSESTGSQTSVGTVINRDVASKISFFERQARPSSRSPRRVRHQSVTDLVSSYEQLYQQHSRSQGDLRQYDRSPLPHTSPRAVPSSQSKSCVDLAWTYSNEDLREAQRTCTSYYFMPHYVPERSVSTMELNRDKSGACFPGRQETPHSLSKSTDFWDPNRSSTFPRGLAGRKLAASTADCRMDDRTKYWRTYLLKVRTGEVQKLREKFESLEYLVIPGATNFSGRRVQSTPNVSRTYASTEHLSRSPKSSDTSDNNRLKRKHEDTKSYRKACSLPRTCRPRETKSQSPERREAQFGEGLRKIQSMPNVESRLLQRVQTGDVEKLKTKFEHVLQTDGRVSLLGQMYTSTPELRELGPCFSWASHCQKFGFHNPKVKHPSSPDPKKKVDFSINVDENENAPHFPVYSQSFPSPKTYQSSIHRPIIRHSSKESVYRSDMTWSGLTKQHESTSAQNQTLTMRQASPHRYLEGEVNIHYRSPTRILEKEYINEEELRNKQQEAMLRFYEEEKRKKQMMEIDDLERRRHHDFITPLQNSPINLQRYENMFEDPSSKSRDRTPDPKVVAKALYNFTAQSARELTFKKGDIIYVRRQVDKNWYEGEHNAMVGIFPVSYVEIIPYDGVRNQSKTYKEGQARAKYNFIAQTPSEMSLVKGSTLTAKSANPVTMNGSVKTNVIKSSSSPYYSSISASTLSSSREPVTQNLHIETRSEPMRYRVLYNYRPRNEDELELKEGDTVLVVEKCDDGWYVGSSQRTGLFGTFPGNYVQRI